MRSRYVGFALGLGAYLAGTLASTHPDSKAPRDALVRQLSRQKDTFKFLGLTIWYTSDEGDTGEVLFHARVFEHGKDRSFAELSTFVREEGAWRYAGGVLVPGAKLGKSPEKLTRDAFLALATRALN